MNPVGGVGNTQGGTLNGTIRGVYPPKNQTCKVSKEERTKIMLEGSSNYHDKARVRGQARTGMGKGMVTLVACRILAEFSPSLHHQSQGQKDCVEICFRQYLLVA